VIAQAIEDEELPLATKDAHQAWDPVNPYREIDQANMILPLPKDVEKKDMDQLT